MRILLTNDDGINAPGLAVLQEIAEKLAGPSGEVWTVAPAFEQSGVGHCISYAHPFMIAKLGERRYAAEGSPADCVLAALYDVFKGHKPDLVLSGVNRGNNSGENVVYSGTLGGAMEAALQGIPAIALSQFMGREGELADPFESARLHGESVVRKLLEHGHWASEGYRTFYNVNFPALSAKDTKGLKVAPQGLRQGSGFSIEAQMSPVGRRYLWLKGGPQHTASAPEHCDVAANVAGYISVTPLRADLTAHDLLADLEARLA